MADVGTVIARFAAGEVGQHPAGFVHQKVGCGKVPVMGIRAGHGRVDLAAATRAIR